MIPNVDDFDDVFKNTLVYDLLKDKFDWVNEYVTNNIKGCKNSFITFSTNITGAKIGVKHLHSLLNGDNCHVCSVAVPLYIDSECNDTVGFWYNSQENLFPPRYYVDYERIKKLDESGNYRLADTLDNEVRKTYAQMQGQMPGVPSYSDFLLKQMIQNQMKPKPKETDTLSPTKNTDVATLRKQINKLISDGILQQKDIKNMKIS